MLGTVFFDLLLRGRLLAAWSERVLQKPRRARERGCRARFAVSFVRRTP